MKNPAAAAPVAPAPAAPAPPVAALAPDAGGPNPRPAPSIHPDTTAGPSPSGSPAGSEPTTGSHPATHPAAAPSSPSVPFSSFLSALPVSPATVPVDACSSDDELMDAPPDALASPPDVAAASDAVAAALAAVAPTPAANVTAASTAAAVAAADDEPMESPPADAAPPARADTRPTMADLLREQETIRRDDAVIEAVRSRIQTPKPLASDIESIERQYAAGSGWSFIASRMDQARPYALPRARFDMVVDTGRTFAKTPLQKIMASLAGSHHGNTALEKLYGEHAIGQVSKLPGGNLRVKVKTQDACMQLERTKVTILGGVYMFKEYDVLAGKYFLDISNVDSDIDTDTILHRLFILGCKPIYDTFREVNLATGITSATWRVYFLSRSCPPALMVNGSVCDQILFDNKLHPAHGKNAPYQSERLPYGYRSLHGIDLLTSDDVFPRLDVRTESPSSPQAPQASQPPAAPKQPQAPPKTLAQATTNGNAMTSLQRAVGEAKTRDRQLQIGAQHGSPPGANQLAKLPSDRDDALSISTFVGSSGKITPPGSPKSSSKPPVQLLTNGGNGDGYTVATNKKKRGRGDIDFSALLTKQQPQPLDGIATENYFQALQSMEVELELKDATADKKHGVRKQVVPVNVKRPETVKSATESAFFIEKHHTKIKKAAKASPILEVTESMVNDENTALLDTQPDKLAAADEKVGSMVKFLENATNPDHIIKPAVQCPLAFNSALSLKMDEEPRVIGDVAQLHVINRVLCATFPGEDTTFATKWKRVMGASVPSKRHDIFKACAKWWTHSDAIRELSRASKALGMFELSLMSIAPTLFKNDHWIQYVTGQPVEWIPAHHTRFLHPNTLLRLLRSELGSHCMQQWREVQWQGHLLDDLEALRKLDGFYPDDSSVLKVHVTEDGVVTTVAGGLSTRC